MKPAAMAAAALKHGEPAGWCQRRWEQWCNWRDRTVGSARFQHWAAGFVFTRPVARRRARELFDIVAGFGGSSFGAVHAILVTFDTEVTPRIPVTVLHQFPAVNWGALAGPRTTAPGFESAAEIERVWDMAMVTLPLILDKIIGD